MLVFESHPQSCCMAPGSSSPRICISGKEEGEGTYTPSILRSLCGIYVEVPASVSLPEPSHTVMENFEGGLAWLVFFSFPPSLSFLFFFFFFL